MTSTTRTLPLAQAIAVSSVISLVGLTIDLATGSSLRTAFAISFALGSAAAAWLVRPADLRLSVAAPAFAYCVLAWLAMLLGRTTVTGSLLTRSWVSVADALVLHAPVLYSATGAALAVVVLRTRRQL